MSRNDVRNHLMIKALKMIFFTQQVMQTYPRTLYVGNPDHPKHLATYFEQDHIFFF